MLHPDPGRAVLPALLAGFSLCPELSQSQSQSDSLPLPTGHFHGHGGCGCLCQADEARRWVPGPPLPLTLSLCPCLLLPWPWVHLGVPEPPSLSQDLPTREPKSWREAEPVEAESSQGLCPP